MKHKSLYLLEALMLSLLAAACGSSDHIARARPMGPDKEPPRLAESPRPDTVRNRHTDPTIQIPGSQNSEVPNAFGATFASGAISYIVDDQTYTGEVRTDEDLTTLYLKLLDYAKLGHSVCIAAPNSTCLGEKGETVNFSSTSERAVTEWATKMIKRGYSVTIDYNKSTRTYHCTAYKPK